MSNRVYTETRIEYAIIAVLALVGMCMFAMRLTSSYNVFADLPFAPYLGWQWVNGILPYRDVFNPHPMGEVYFFGLLHLFMPPGMMVIQVYMLLLFSMTFGGVYALIRTYKLAKPPLAIAVSFFTASCFYWYYFFIRAEDLTLLMALLAILCSSKFLLSTAAPYRRYLWLFLCAFCCVFAVLSKPAGITAALLSLTIFSFDKKPLSVSIHFIAVCALLCSALFTTYYLNGSLLPFFDNVFGYGHYYTSYFSGGQSFAKWSYALLSGRGTLLRLLLFCGVLVMLMINRNRQPEKPLCLIIILWPLLEVLLSLFQPAYWSHTLNNIYSSATIVVCLYSLYIIKNIKEQKIIGLIFILGICASYLPSYLPEKLAMSYHKPLSLFFDNQKSLSEDDKNAIDWLVDNKSVFNGNAVNLAWGQTYHYFAGLKSSSYYYFPPLFEKEHYPINKPVLDLARAIKDPRTKLIITQEPNLGFSGNWTRHDAFEDIIDYVPSHYHLVGVYPTRIVNADKVLFYVRNDVLPDITPFPVPKGEGH